MLISTRKSSGTGRERAYTLAVWPITYGRGRTGSRENGVNKMEAAPGVYSLAQSQGGFVHAYLLDDGSGGLTMVDALFDTDAHRILALLQSIGKAPRDIQNIIVTHAHRSHLGGLARLKELT